MNVCLNVFIGDHFLCWNLIYHPLIQNKAKLCVLYFGWLLNRALGNKKPSQQQREGNHGCLIGVPG